MSHRALAASTVGFAVLSLPSVASATGVTEFPDNGSEQSGRGGAWVARASDPLAVFFNPAGLAGQPTRIIVQSNINFQKTCFTRLKASGDSTLETTQPGQFYPKVCSNDGAAIDPQIAFTLHVNDRVGIGIAPILAPSAGASTTSFPEFITTTAANGKTFTQPGPERYLLTGGSAVVLTPTIGIGVEVVKRLRLGASFQWGIASLQFSNAVVGVNQDSPNPGSNDVKSTLTVHDYFVPGFTLGALASPTDDFDIAGWYKWSDSIRATGDVATAANYFSTQVANGNTSGVATGNTGEANCGITSPATFKTTACGSGNNAKVTVAIPMEAKIGFRFHKRRSDVPYDEHVRDPMAQDVFDVEADLTYANDSAFQNLQIRFPGTAGNPYQGSIPVNLGGGLTSVAPPNADVPHFYKDVYGVRIGGDYNVLRDQWALRVGGFFESNGQNPQYQNIDFMGSARFGFALGTTYRIHLGHKTDGTARSNAIELSAGYEHVFYLTESNYGPNGIEALAGSQCNPATANAVNAPTCGGTINNSVYRSNWPVNLGTITSEVNVLNVGLGYKF